MTFYSHIDHSPNGTPRVQTVTEHCRQAAAYARSTLDPIGLGSAGYLAGLVHDMGKMKQEFQRYLLDGTGRRGSVNHTFAGCRLLLTRFHGEQVASCEDLTAELLAFAAGAHHGLFDCVDRDRESGFLHRLKKENIGYLESLEHFLAQCADIDELNSLFHAANEALTPVYERIGLLAGDSSEEFAFYQGLLARLLLSAVIEGDRRDTAEFMTGITSQREPEDLRIFWRPYLAHLEEKLKIFAQDTPIGRARAEISRKCRTYGENRGGIIRLNVPTGGGKTLSSLRYALRHAEKWGKHRLIFTAPLLTILEQNAAVIRDYLGDDSIVLEHHSNVVEPVSPEENELDLRELAVDSWHSPVIVTTLVQFLNVLFAGKTTAVRRFQSLCDSVIVIDEVQTVPSSMLSLFDLAVNFLADVCGATVVLCSATQPCLEQVPHPIRPDPAQMVPYERKLWEIFRRTQIIDGGAMTLEQAIPFIRQSMEETESLLVICNKKEQARYLLQALDGVAQVCCHLSASMCPAHRRQTLAQLYQALREGKSCLCVATQVIEAGVDISFGRVIRFTAGLDSIVQAAGRCNRNGERACASVYVVTLLNENLHHLADIQRGKNATVSLLEAYRREPERFDCDLASDAAVSYYYRQYYGAMPLGAQDYPLKKDRTSLLALLAVNESCWDDTSSFYGRFMLAQAFRTAGDAFTVFDSDTQDVIVSYGDGEVLIGELMAQPAASVPFLKQWVSRAKSYTISLYSYQLKALADVIVEHNGVKILPREYYDEQTGFSMQAGTLDYLEV